MHYPWQFWGTSISTVRVPGSERCIAGEVRKDARRLDTLRYAIDRSRHHIDKESLNTTSYPWTV